jgi:hypothetical protein
MMRIRARCRCSTDCPHLLVTKHSSEPLRRALEGVLGRGADTHGTLHRLLISRIVTLQGCVPGGTGAVGFSMDGNQKKARWGGATTITRPDLCRQ